MTFISLSCFAVNMSKNIHTVRAKNKDPEYNHLPFGQTNGLDEGKKVYLKHSLLYY